MVCTSWVIVLLSFANGGPVLLRNWLAMRSVILQLLATQLCQISSRVYHLEHPFGFVFLCALIGRSLWSQCRLIGKRNTLPLLIEKLGFRGTIHLREHVRLWRLFNSTPNWSLSLWVCLLPLSWVKTLLVSSALFWSALVDDIFERRFQPLCLTVSKTDKFSPALKTGNILLLLLLLMRRLCIHLGHHRLNFFEIDIQR